MREMVKTYASRETRSERRHNIAQGSHGPVHRFSHNNHCGLRRDFFKTLWLK